MKKAFYYIHLQAANFFIDQDHKVFIESLPKDNVFSALDIYIKKRIDCIDITEYKLTLQEVKQISFAEDFNNESGIEEMQSFYLAKININGLPMVDHFGMYQNTHLIASSKGLELLRKFGVIDAEIDLIKISLETYFAQSKHLFWMPEKHRNMFIRNFKKK